MRRDGPGARRFAASRSRIDRKATEVERAEWQRERDVRVAVFQRDGMRCVLHPYVGTTILTGADPDDLDALGLVEVPRCWGHLEFGHRRKASSGGAYVEANGRTVCQAHNFWTEDEPDAARLINPDDPTWLVVREGDPEWHSLGRKANGVR